MPLPRLLVVLLAFSSLTIAFAEDLPIQPRKNAGNFIKPYSTNALTSEQKDYMNAVGQDSLEKWRDGIHNPDVTCYTMRTYVVDNNIDKKFVLKAGPNEVAYTPPVRNGSPLTSTYTTCQPSTQFEVKKTIQPVEIGNDGK